MFNYNDLFHSWPLLACGLFLMIAVATAAYMSAHPATAQKKIVFYARFSSDNQREESIEDQFRNIANHLDRMGIPHGNAIKLADEAITGTTTNREDFQVLLEMLRRNEVGLVAVDDMSRLTRGKDYGLLWDEMAARGCRFISVIDGLDSTRDGDELSAMVKGLMNNITNKIGGRRSRRGLVGRVLDPDASAGDYPYGYESRFSDPDAAARYTGAGPKPKKDLFINEEQANVVRMIFRLYAEEEWSPSQIARYLNEQNIPMGNRSHRKNKDGTRYSNGWHKVLIRKMLGQRKYIGDWNWGKNIYTKTPDGKRIVRPANPLDVSKSDKPHRALISMELWDKTQARLKSFAQKYGYKDGQRKRGRQSHYTEDYPNSPLGGLLYCGECGSRLHFVPENKGQGPYYGCPIAQSRGRNKGVHRCSQRGYVHKERAMVALSDYIGECMRDSDGWQRSVYDLAKHEYLRQQEAAPGELETLRKKRKELDSAIANLMKALETAAGAPETLMKRLGELEAQRGETERAFRMLEARNDRVASLPTQEWIQEQLRDLAGVFMEEPSKAAKLFREFFGKVHVDIIVAPGKKRGHPVLRFAPNRNRLIAGVVNFPLPETMGGKTSSYGDVVTLSLTGSDKLDKLMPAIDAMRRDGVEWREICVKLKIARSWTNLYYNRWKKLTQETGEADGGKPSPEASASV